MYVINFNNIYLMIIYMLSVNLHIVWSQHDTAILRVYNDVMCSLDKRRDAIFIMLDLSAAFDTMNHGILLHRLHKVWNQRNSS